MQEARGSVGASLEETIAVSEVLPDALSATATYLPGQTLSQEDFEAFREIGYLVAAFDGLVADRPYQDLADSSGVLNFDHHVGVDRWRTDATALQVYKAITNPEEAVHGIIKTGEFSDGTALAGLRGYANDPDQDSSLAVFLWQNARLVQWLHEHPELPASETLEKFVYDSSDMDRTSAYTGRYLSEERLAIMNRVYSDYSTARLSGKVHSNDRNQCTETYEQIYRAMEQQMFALLDGSIEPLPPDYRYEVLLSNDTLSVVHEMGQDSRVGMFRDGIERFISVIKEEDGRWFYSIGLSEPRFGEDLTDLYATLNAQEVGSQGPFGGSNMIGGSLRIGSALPPQQLAEIATDYFRSSVSEHLVKIGRWPVVAATPEREA